MKSLIVRGDQIPSEGAKQASSLPAPNPPEHEFRSLLSGRITLIVQTGVGEPALVRLIPLIPQVHQRTRRFFQPNLPPVPSSVSLSLVLLRWCLCRGCLCARLLVHLI